MEEFLSNLWANLSGFALTVGGRLLGAIVAYIIGAIIIKVIVKSIAHESKHPHLDPTVKGFLASFVKIALNLVLLVIVVAILGVPTASIISIIASAGVTVGLALQGSLSNLAGGIMILIFKPFKLGDFIECGSGSGTVISVGTFYTTIRTGDNKHIIVPNGSLSNAAVTNYSVEAERRVDMVFTVGYGTDLKTAYSAINSVIATCDMIDTEKEPYVRLSELADSSVNITVRVWCKSADYFAVKADIMEKVYDKFNADGIEIPFPQLSVHFDEKK